MAAARVTTAQMPTKKTGDELQATEVELIRAALNEHAGELDGLAFPGIAATADRPAFPTALAAITWLLAQGSIRELVLPQQVTQNALYLLSTGIWAARRSMAATAYPVVGPNWRLVASFQGAASSTSATSALELAPGVFLCSPDLLAQGLPALIWLHLDGTTTPVGGQFNGSLLYATNRPLDGSVLAYTDSSGALVPVPTSQPGPYIELALANTGPMLRADPPVLAWREYAITGDWNAAGTDSTVYVAGLTTRRWASLGWVLDAKGNPQTVQLDVQAKTWVAFEALLATKQPALTKRAQYPKYTSDYKSFTAENFGHIVVVDTTQGQPFSKNLPAITLADVPQILQVRNLGGSGNGDALTLVSVSSDESFVLLPGERAVFVAVEISRGYPYNDVVAGWDILAAERPQLAGRGLVKTGNTFHARVKVSTDTILTFMESGTYAVISSGTFTVDTTAAEPGVVVFAELAPAATQPTLPPQFELVGNDYQTGKRQGFAAQVMPSGQIEYFFYLKP